MPWLDAPDYWLARLMFQRGLAVIYLVAFLGTVLQFRALIGERGITPIPKYVRRVPFRRAPSLFQLRYSDRLFAVVGCAGVAVSVALLLGASDAVPLWASMLWWAVPWLLYLSIVNVGQIWYGFGWETLLLETGFLAIFMGNATTAPSLLVLILVRWLLLRVEFGAGLIKLRGDPCWRDLTCLRYHHETQPMPGPLSWFFHRTPDPFHRAEVLGNHVAQLVATFLLFTPQPVATIAALFIIVTQLWLVSSGNFAWLNWLTIVLALSVLDTSLLDRVLPLPAQPTYDPTPQWYVGVVIALTLAVVVLSYRPARNLVSRRQLMNASFEPLRLVNTYGAFGTISRERYEVVVEGTDEPDVTEDTAWREYEFKGKPTDPHRLPPQVAPYHLRLDWQMWFAGLAPMAARPWLIPMLRKLLDGDRDLLRLLRGNPFPDSPPRWVRARLYRYEFTYWSQRRRTGAWWRRTLVTEFVPPMRS